MAVRLAYGDESIGSSGRQASGTTVLTQFSEPQRRQALDRFGVLRPHVEDDVPLAEIA